MVGRVMGDVRIPNLKMNALVTYGVVGVIEVDMQVTRGIC